MVDQTHTNTVKPPAPAQDILANRRIAEEVVERMGGDAEDIDLDFMP